MVIHYTKDNAGSFAAHFGITQRQAELIIGYMEGSGHSLFAYSPGDEPGGPKNSSFKLYRLDVQEFGAAYSFDHTSVHEHPLKVFDGMCDSYSILEAVTTIREWIWGKIDCDEIEDEREVKQMEQDDAELAKCAFEQGINYTSFVNKVKDFGHDNMGLVIKAANVSGTMEAKKEIEVHDWDALTEAITDFVNWYLNDEEAGDCDFFEELGKRLKKNFPVDM